MTERSQPPDETHEPSRDATTTRTREVTGGEPEAPPPRAYPDPVDDALDDSFPASDPPQWWGGDSTDGD